MRRLTRPGAGLIALLWLAFTPLGVFVPNSQLFEILNSLCVATSIGVVVMFWQGLWKILKKPVRQWEAGDVLIIGVMMAAVSIAGIFTALWIYRAAGMPPSSGHMVEAVFRWGLASGMTLHLVASGSEDGRIPSRAYRRAGIFVALGIGAALVLISLGVS